jgi:hypothetical protein
MTDRIEGDEEIEVSAAMAKEVDAVEICQAMCATARGARPTGNSPDVVNLRRRRDLGPLAKRRSGLLLG